MLNRVAWYRTAVITCAVLSIVPHCLLVVNFILQPLGKPIWKIPFPTDPGMQSFFADRQQLQELTFWNDKFIHLADVYDNDGTVTSRRVLAIDPESGDQEVLSTSLPGGDRLVPEVCLDQLLFDSSRSSGEVYALVNGGIESALEYPPPMNKGEPRFLLGDHLAELNLLTDPSKVYTWQYSRWVLEGSLAIPEGTRNWSHNEAPIQISPSKIHFQQNNGSKGIQVFNHDGQIHLFAHVDSNTTGLKQPTSLLYRTSTHLFHYQGSTLPLRGIPPEPDNSQQSTETNSVPGLDPATTNAEMEKWTLVREQPVYHYIGFGQVNAGLIAGRAAAILIDIDLKKLTPHGIKNLERAECTTNARLFELKDDNWQETATRELPFATLNAATFVTNDAQRMYLATRSFTGETSVYSVESGKISETAGSASLKTRGIEWQNPFLERRRTYALMIASVLCAALLIGGILCSFIAVMMSFVTDPEYSFATQHIRLASLGKRGIARLIDLTLVAVLSIAFNWWLWRDFDFVGYEEATYMWFRHPSLELAPQYFLIGLVGALGIYTALVIVPQILWGTSPGKCLLGLRTIQTTLRPCSMVNGLTREFMLVIDCANFLCWTPGILSIALTDHRQRLGDLVADTIVIESRSMTTKSDQTI